MVESEEVSAGAAKQTQEPSGSVYVVLRRESLSVDLSMTDYRGKESVTVWREIATVVLASRSHRKSAIGAALAKAGESATPGMAFRVLDADCATVLKLAQKPKPPVDEQFEVVVAE